MNSLSKRLKTLGLRVGVSRLPPPTRPAAWTIEDVLPGRLIDTAGGPVYLVENFYPTGYRHGRAVLELSAPLQIIAEWAGEPSLAGKPPETFAFLDTETSGLAGGTGTFAFLVGIGRFQEGGFCLRQFFLRDPLEEAGLLLALEEFLAPCQAVVSFNGKAFDSPLLNTRYILQGWKTPLSGLAQVDLLHLARRIWRERLPSRTLGNLEVQILGAPRNEQEIPGWMIPQMYFDYLRDRDARPLKHIFYHNAMDVISLAALLQHLALLLEAPLQRANDCGLDQAAIARLLEELGRIDEAICLYRQSLKNGLPPQAFHNTLERLSHLLKKQGDYPAAISLWEQAAAEQQIYAFVELAKYYEHRALDFEQARTWTQAALEIIRRPTTPAYTRLEWQGNLEHRLQRLERKTARLE